MVETIPVSLPLSSSLSLPLLGGGGGGWGWGVWGLICFLYPGRMIQTSHLVADDVLLDESTTHSEFSPKQVIANDALLKRGVVVVENVLTDEEGSSVNTYLEECSTLKGLWNGNHSATPDDSARQIASVDLVQLQQKTGFNIFNHIKYA
jgi:hypothetical protein